MRTRFATSAAIAPLVLGVVACSGDEASGDDGSSQGAGSSSSVGSAGSTPGRDFTEAAETALGEVDGTVVGVGREADGWDVTVVTADGAEHDVELSTSGASVTRHRVETAADDPDDAAERRRLLGAATDLASAIEAALGEVEGTITGVELAEDDGSVTWEVELDEETPDATTVAVDAETGEVIGTEQGE